MPARVGLTACRTIARELRQCCRELGIPAEVYANQPGCLCEGELGRLLDVARDAAGRHDRMLLAWGACCGDVDAMADETRAAAVSAEKCTEMLLGSGTYGWSLSQGILLLPPPYFSEYLEDPALRPAAERMIDEQIAATGAESVAGISQPLVSIPEAGIAEIERIAHRRTASIYTGLGHLRQTIRTVATLSGLPVGTERPIGIAAGGLGPGDQCLVLDGEASHDPAIQLVMTNLSRGVRCIWLAGEQGEVDTATAIERMAPGIAQARESRQLEIIPAEAAVDAAGAEADPRKLVRHWITEALGSMAQGGPGVCVVHGCGWSERAGLDAEYVLEYTSRLSSACGRWPIFAASEVAAQRLPVHILEELSRTHPLVWTDGAVTAAPAYEHDYLGGEELLEELDGDPGELKCSSIGPLVSALVDGELEESAAKAVESHTTSCPDCARLVERNRKMKEALRPLRLSVEDTSDLWSRISHNLGNGQ